MKPDVADASKFELYIVIMLDMNIGREHFLRFLLNKLFSSSKMPNFHVRFTKPFILLKLLYAQNDKLVPWMWMDWNQLWTFSTLNHTRWITVLLNICNTVEKMSGMGSKEYMKQ